jgi:hypothetical protein
MSPAVNTSPRGRLTIRLTVTALLVLVAALLVLPVARLGVRVSLNYNEGWNAYHAQAFALGVDLYPPSDALVTNNYPPLSFAIVGWLGSLAKADFVKAGRALSLASLLVVAAVAGLLVRHATARPLAAVFGASVLLLYCLLHFDMYVGMNDPSWLAHATAMVGFLTLVKARTSSGAALGAALSAAALFIKHSVIPLPVTTAVWAVARVDDRRARAWLASFSASLVLAFVVASVLWGTNFWRAVFTSPRDVSVWYLAAKSVEFLVPMTPIFGVTLLASRVTATVVPTFYWFYFVISLAWGGLMMSGDGVSYNAVFDVLIALVLLAGSIVGDPSLDRRSAMVMAIALSLAPGIPASLLRVYGQLASLSATEKSSEAQIAVLAAAPPPVACQTLALCYWARQPMAVDFFNLGQKARVGTISEAEAACVFEEGRFNRLELDSPTPGISWLPQRINEAIGRAYVAAIKTGNRVIYSPNRAPLSPECQNIGTTR